MHAQSKGVVGNIADFGNDVFTLVELQTKLAASDLSEVKGRLITVVLLAVAAVVFVIGAVPVALFGVADLIAYALGIKLGLALLVTGLSVLLASCLAIWLLLPRIFRAFEPLRRSREEFIRNVDWVRTVLVHSGRSFR